MIGLSATGPTARSSPAMSSFSFCKSRSPDLRSGWLRDVGGGPPSFLVHPFPDVVLLDPEGARHMAHEIADRQTIMRVVETWRRMDVADDLAVLLKHHDERVLEHERLAARSAADAR